MSTLEERYGALQAKTVLLVGKYREQEAQCVEAEEALKAKEQLVSLLVSERDREREEAAARQHELETKLAAAERRARAAELREEERTARLQVVLARLRGRHDEDSVSSDDGDEKESPRVAAEDSGTDDSSETSGQSDSGEEGEAAGWQRKCTSNILDQTRRRLELRRGRRGWRSRARRRRRSSGGWPAPSSSAAATR
jgi:hypothetical protein